LYIAILLVLSFILLANLASVPYASDLSRSGSTCSSSDTVCGYLDIFFSKPQRRPTSESEADERLEDVIEDLLLHGDPDEPRIDDGDGGKLTKSPDHDHAIGEEAGNAAKHTYDSSSGLLTVNPDAAHPIFELTRRAEERWASKLSRQSKTLPEAVREYQRRYGRPPPAGFDRWWAYVAEHDVQLPDEYDSINEDLEPYWGHEPAFLRALQAEREGWFDSVTIGKDGWGSPAGLVNLSIAEERRERMTEYYLMKVVRPHLEILRDVEEWIPPFRATFGTDDRPGELQDWEWKERAVQAAKNKQCECAHFQYLLV
jgi:hypothetical protein